MNRKIVKLLVALTAINCLPTSAQEFCMTCKGTKWQAASSIAPKEDLKNDQHFGFCFDQKTKKISFVSEGHDTSSWKFDRTEGLRDKPFPHTYFYWTSKATNWLFGEVSEQIELSDVVLHFQYVARNKEQRPVLATNGTCVPSIRIKE
jgi:hypothetical protein